MGALNLDEQRRLAGGEAAGVKAVAALRSKRA
jgi:hypothetical protein